MWIPKLLAVVQLLVAVMAEFASIVDIGPYRHTLITQHNHYRKKIEATKMKEMVSKEKKKNKKNYLAAFEFSLLLLY